MTEDEELRVIRRVIDGEVETRENLVVHYQDRLLQVIATLLHHGRRHSEPHESSSDMGQSGPLKGQPPHWPEDLIKPAPNNKRSKRS